MSQFTIHHENPLYYRFPGVPSFARIYANIGHLSLGKSPVTVSLCQRLARVKANHLKTRWWQVYLPLNLPIVRAAGGNTFSFFHERHIEVSRFQAYGLRIKIYIPGISLIVAAIGEGKPHR